MDTDGRRSPLPARKKPPGTRQDNRRQRSSGLAIVPPSGVATPAVPKPPAGLLVSTQTAWVQFWSSITASAATEDVDMVLVERWIFARDEWQRALNAVRRKRLVSGSMHQPVLNPLASWVQSREAVMAKLEEQLGVGPKNRSHLGITIGQAQLTIHELNKATEEHDGDGDAEEVDAEEAEILADFEEA